MTTEPIGTNLNHFVALKDKLNPDMQPRQVTDAVKAYWDEPDNIAARGQATTRSENGLYTMSMMASFDEYISDVIQYAATDPVAWDALHGEFIRRFKAGESVPPAAVDVIERGKPGTTGRPKGGSPAIGHRDKQLALAVLAVHLGANYSLATDDTTGRNAFGVVADATEIKFESVKKAWSQNPRYRDFKKGKKVR